MRTPIRRLPAAASRGALALLGGLLVAAAGCGEDAGPATCDDACFFPPPPSCAGDQLVSFGLLGECVDGACEYPRTARACAQGCLDGACVEDLCNAQACASPPPPACEGGVAVLGTFAGDCDPETGGCVYAEQRTDCAAAGQACEGGACVEPEPCGGALCGTPPADACDGAVAVRYPAVGACVDDACEYLPDTEDCAANEQACVDGACVDVGPCDGITCEAPPVAACDGSTAVTYDTPGECRAGNCIYDEVRTSCPAVVADGRCVDGACLGPDPCEGVACDMPPTSTCEGAIAVGYPDDGVCADGDCVYTPARTDCAALGQRCVAGRCVGLGACEGVVCDAPPAPECRGQSAVTFSGGVCDEGACVYEQTRTDCAVIGQICVRGACSDSTRPCADVCPVAPAPRCDGDTLTTFAVPGGLCADGVCAFDITRVDCAADGGFCDAGRCVERDPCEGVVCDDPPADVCLGSASLRYPSLGTCASGTCFYAPSTVDCAEEGGVCEAGACDYGAACDGVVCDEAPSADCDGTVAITFPSGECRGGRCAWDPVRRDCAAEGARCSSGACIPVDPCLGVTCISAPPSFCEGRTAVAYASPGTCDDGDCTFAQVRTDCAATGRYCQAGACVAVDPCLGVVCDAPPAPSCDGFVRVTRAAGTCVEGGCVYDPVRFDCTAENAICVGGACEGGELCDGVTCDSPRAPICVGGRAEGFATPGVCRAGTCAYEPAVDDCGARGEFCIDGACVDEDPCDATTCDTPAEPDRCEGGTAVQSIVPGGCLDGVCSYATRRVDCAARGEVCDGGRCVVVDPCDGITCDTPPADVCDGDVARQYDAPSACIEGECVWDTRTVDCGAAGQRCVDGACVDACVGVTCTEPPPSRCDEGNTLVTYGAGTCSAGACRYAEVRTPCGAGAYCDGSACVSYCDGVVCDEELAWCEGDTRRAYVTPGRCVGSGDCAYDVVDDDCADLGQRCVLGECYAGDPCDRISCGPVDNAFCEGNTAVVVDGVGVCDDGDCDYAAATTRTPCGARACLLGACTDVEPAEPGDLAITEFAARSFAGSPEWIEVTNVAGVRRSIVGLTLRNAAGQSWTWSGATTLDPGEFIVLGSADSVGPTPVDARWSSYTIADAGDRIAVVIGDNTLDSVTFSTAAWPATDAAAPALAASEYVFALGNEWPDLWCAAAGSPGAANPPCFVCEEATDCPSLAPRCLGSVANTFGAPVCGPSGECLLISTVTQDDCADSPSGVCVDGACAPE